jgi:hypothetical protein
MSKINYYLNIGDNLLNNLLEKWNWKKTIKIQGFDFGREVLKWVALISMTIDHIGVIFYPQVEIFDIIGRITFPLISYILVLGYETTKNWKKYTLRLILFACMSQIPFSLATGYGFFEYFNTFFTLFFGILTLYNPILYIIPFLASFLIYFDYGVYGIALILSMQILKQDIKFGIILITFLNLLLFSVRANQMFSLLALPFIIIYQKGYLQVKLKKKKGERKYPNWRKYFFYIYYPLHLTIFYLVNQMFI